jgi:GAF domain-containing protein
MIVPIVVGDEVIGTIGLDAVSGPRKFTREEKWLAETIAYHAAIAIQSAWRYEELKHTKGLVGARTALAWMGMANSAWRHSIEGYAINICNAITLLRQEIQSPPIGLASQQTIENKFDLIERLATQILEKPITPPLSSEEGVEVVMVNGSTLGE